MRYKLCKFCENRARDTPLRGVYIPDFGQIWVKIPILGVLHPCRCTNGGEIWHGGDGKFQPHRCNVSPLRGEKPQHRPLSKLNTGRFALHAMLPVIRLKSSDKNQHTTRNNITANYGQNSVLQLQMSKCLRFWGLRPPDPLPDRCHGPSFTVTWFACRIWLWNYKCVSIKYKYIDKYVGK